MDVRQLRYFVKIVGCGSFSRAAVELRVAQPALSQHVANLEAELGVELLSRSTRGVTPTECGRTLLGHAEVLLRQLDHAARDVRDKAGNPSGSVTIGIPSSASLVLTVPLLRESEVRYPGIELKVIEHHSGYLSEWLQAGQIDLAILFDLHEIAGIAVQSLLREELYFASPPGRFPRDQAEIHFAQLAELPLILTSRAHGLRMLVERYARDAGGPLAIKTELDSLSAIKDLVADGFGFTLLPWPAIRREVAAGSLHAMKVVEPTVARTVQLAMAADMPPTRSTDCIAGLVRTLLGELVAQDRWRGVLLPPRGTT